MHSESVSIKQLARSLMIRLGLAMVAVGFVSALPVSAAFIPFSRLAINPDEGTLPVPNAASNWAAAQFRVGPQISAVTFSQVNLIYEQGALETTDLSGLSLYIFSDQADRPFSEISAGAFAFGIRRSLTGTGVATFTSNNSLTLAADAAYWVLMESSNGLTDSEIARWSFIESFNTRPPVWRTTAFFNLPSVVVVPETSTSVMGLVGALLMGALARCRIRREGKKRV